MKDRISFAIAKNLIASIITEGLKELKILNLAKAAEEYHQTGCVTRAKFTLRDQFLVMFALYHALSYALKPHLCAKAFKSAGIIPFNPEAVVPDVTWKECGLTEDKALDIVGQYVEKMGAVVAAAHAAGAPRGAPLEGPHAAALASARDAGYAAIDAADAAGAGAPQEAGTRMGAAFRRDFLDEVKDSLREVRDTLSSTLDGLERALPPECAVRLQQAHVVLQQQMLRSTEVIAVREVELMHGAGLVRQTLAFRQALDGGHTQEDLAERAKRAGAATGRAMFALSDEAFPALMAECEARDTKKFYNEVRKEINDGIRQHSNITVVGTTVRKQVLKEFLKLEDLGDFSLSTATREELGVRAYKVIAALDKAALKVPSWPPDRALERAAIQRRVDARKQRERHRRRV
jgi:hypothetical protein